MSRKHVAALAAIAIDTLGAGAFYPLTILYLAATGLSAQRAGVLVTLGGVLAIPAGPLTGSLVDRWGPRRVLVAGNLLSAAGYLLLAVPATGNGSGTGTGVWAGQALTALAVTGVAERCFWSSWNVFIAERVPPGELDQWYGRLNAVRAACLGAGAVTAAAAVAVGGVEGMRAALVFNVISSLAAAWLYSRDDHRRAVSRRRAARRASSGSWRVVLRDRPFLVMTAGQTALCFAWLIPAVILPLYLTATGTLPVWVPSAAVALNTGLAVVAQTAVTRRVARYRRTLVVAAGSVFILAALVMLASARYPASRALAVAIVLAGVLFFTAGELAIGPASAALSVDAAPPDLRGRYSSVYQTSWTVSSVLGPAMIALLLGVGAWWLWGTLLALVASGGICYALLTRRLTA